MRNIYSPSALALAALAAGDTSALIDSHRASFGGHVMVQTDSSDVINPEVWGDMAQAEFSGAVKVLTSGAVVYDNTLEGAPGDTVSLGSWDALTELADLTETTALVPEQFGTSDQTVTIKEAGKAVEITDKAKLVALGDPEAEARRQFGVLSARKLDGDLITAALADTTATGGGVPLTHTTAEDGVISWGVINAAIEKFGDDFDPEDFAGLFIRSTQRTQLWNDDQFINASKLGDNSIVRRGQIGEVAGIPVFVTDRLPGVVGPSNGKSALIKKNSLAALYKRRPLVESDRDILARSTIVTTTMHYAVKRLKSNGVCVINFLNAA